MNSEEPANQFRFFKNIARLAVYASVALSTFVIFTLLILSIGSSGGSKIVMQDLTGKYFTDVHNDLVQSQIRIQLIQKNYPDQLPGIILYQSVPAGSIISSREKLYLTVNQPVPILTMPSLVGSSLSSAKASLERIPSSTNQIYSLEIGMISRVPSGEFPPNTVLAQFPPAKTSITHYDKAYLLVTASEEDANQVSDISMLKGQNIKIASEMLSRLNLDYRLELFEKEQGTENGEIKDVIRGNDEFIKLQVYFTKQKYRYRNGYERISLELDGQGRCEVIQTPQITEEREHVYVTRKHKESEPVDLLFFREGATRFEVYCGDEMIFNKMYVPDNLG
ncbi:MAG: PASTA domain-containing protein [Spirochaetia bacterium]|nr:PASTA domain-containing protein [Spirochaetia bacterium]